MSITLYRFSSLSSFYPGIQNHLIIFLELEVTIYFLKYQVSIQFQTMTHVSILLSSVCLTNTGILRWKCSPLFPETFFRQRSCSYGQNSYHVHNQYLLTLLVPTSCTSIWPHPVPVFFSSAMLYFKLKFVSP